VCSPGHEKVLTVVLDGVVCFHCSGEDNSCSAWWTNINLLVFLSVTLPTIAQIIVVQVLWLCWIQTQCILPLATRIVVVARLS